MKNTKTLKIVQTAIFLALLIVFQYVTKPMGQVITGSLVNFVLVSSVLTVGLAGGSAVALISPFLAFSLGIGPAVVQLIPMIAIGNFVLVLVYWAIVKSFKGVLNTKNVVAWVIAVVVSSLAKFAALYFGVVKVVLPMLLSGGIINEKQVTVMSAMFSTPQLITALIGGFIAMVVMPPVLKAVSKNK